MGSSTTSKTVKKLGQFLEEQQEPFILEIYLSERGCSIKNKNKKLNSVNFLKKRSVSFNNIIKAAYNKLASFKDSPKIKNNNGSQEISEAGPFSSAWCTNTDFNSCSESPVHLQEDEAASDGKMGWNCSEESEQISPVSVLQEENRSRSSMALAKKITEDSLISGSLWNLFFHPAKDKQCCVGPATELEEQPSSQFYKSKKILQQTRQLLFDCVREVLKERSQQNDKEFMGAELLGKLMSDKIKAWGKQSGDDLNVKRLLDFDFQDSVQEWTDFQPQMRDLAFEIGDAILDDIRDQIVTDFNVDPGKCH